MIQACVAGSHVDMVQACLTNNEFSCVNMIMHAEFPDRYGSENRCREAHMIRACVAGSRVDIVQAYLTNNEFSCVNVVHACCIAAPIRVRIPGT